MAVVDRRGALIAMATRPEVRRQLVHMLVGSPALLLRWLTWWQAALLAGAAVLFNVFVLPRLAPSVFRRGDLDAPLQSGIVIYPLAVLGLILCFPYRLDVAAGAWVILAAGDGAATLVGAHVRTPALPWNPQKSMGGLLAFAVCACAAAVGTAVWMHRGASPLPAWWIVAAPFAAASIAALVETAPIRLNDNISVPAVAALVLWSASAVDPAVAQAAVPALVARLPLALGANLLAASAGWLAGGVTVAGALTGFAIGVVTFACAGPAGWAMLLAAFFAAALTTRAGFRRKALLGIAEARGGRRGPGNAIANTSVAAWAAVVAAGLADPAPARIAMVAALATAASDTVASEVGKAWGKTTWLVVGLRRVAPGTSGAISLEGTAAGIVSAAALAGLGVALHLVPAAAMIAIVGAATIAAFVESGLGATLEGPGILDNDALNFVNSALGAGLAIAFWSIR